jgi:predicted PhzF superfamily epimerase YddE/YHI9
VVDLDVLNVFTDKNGDFGNALGVVLDGAAVDRADRQRIAFELGYSETVFVDDRARGTIQIFTPGNELGFAGHPSVGTAWLLADTGTPVAALHPPAGEVLVHQEGDLTFISARLEWVVPPFELLQLPRPQDVDALTANPPGKVRVCAWAWIDEAEGRIRSRVFPVEFGIVEDEATGACAVQMAATFGRELRIQQGRGSQLLARPAGDGRAEVGGRVRRIERRPLSV